MKTIYTAALFFSFSLLSCFPDNMKEQMGEAIQKSQVIFNDMHFKDALHNIEMYKLRTGNYPDSLGEITFVAEMDRTSFAMVEYARLEDKYELNLKVIPKEPEYYPDEFWIGLGCIKSNMMKPGTVVGTPVLDSIVLADSVIVH